MELISKWYEAYELIAKVLYEFYKLNETSVSQSLYTRLEQTEFKLLNEKRLFNDAFRSDNPGLDPIQVFASFNFPKIKDKRIEIINILLKEFGINKFVSFSTDFEGCPSPIITQIIKYRNRSSQEEIWEMFSSVMQQGFYGFSERNFKAIKGWRGLDIASTTIFLFWIKSENFIALDSNTVKFLISINLITVRPRSFQEYRDLCREFRPDDADKSNIEVFRNFVKDAYHFSDNQFDGKSLSGTTTSQIYKTNAEIDTIETVEEFVERKKRERVKGFQIIAIIPQNSLNENKKGEDQRHLKNLQPGQVYQFYKAYNFDKIKDNIISYNDENVTDLYNQGRINISVCAIVGKNGTGKSTIADFLYLIINKIAYKKKIRSTEKLVNEEVYADLFFKSDRLYKVSIREEIEIFEYELGDKNEYFLKKNHKNGRENFSEFDIENFCYSIVVNYSMYALNTTIIGKWIYPLFHKNDSYQVPIALNPLRQRGNIDVNREESLAKSRMLANLLDPMILDNNNKVVEMVPGSSPLKLIIALDNDKMQRKRAYYFKTNKQLGLKDLSIQIKTIIEAWQIEIKKDLPYADEAMEYLFLKLVSISKYKRFSSFKKVSSWLEDAVGLDEFLDKVSGDSSHITFKIKQTINYLKYGVYHEKELDINAIVNKISAIQSQNDITTIELVPPPFFTVDVKFSHGGYFSGLSSGEKQQIFSINTIAYHINNISSVMADEDSFKYSNVNIIFDEVELYFHPEMQRTYLDLLLHRIDTLHVGENIHNLNIMFITHSPFILSDIPSQNILRLSLKNGQKSFPENVVDKTFGANIHDLLANEFFLGNGFMGEFASKIINYQIKLLEKWKPRKKDDQQNLKDRIYYTIQMIGEPLVKESLMDLYREKIGIHESEFTIEEIEMNLAKFQKLKNDLI